MSGEYFERRSLCYVEERTDWKGDHRLRRIADIEDGKLVAPRKSASSTIFFENRDWIVWFRGPQEVGTIGVWDWTARPSRDNPQIDRVDSWYVPDCRPIYVMVLSEAKSMQTVIQTLKQGIPMPMLDSDYYICFEQAALQYNGVICSRKELNVRGDIGKLKEDIYSLPRYKFTAGDTYVWKDNTNIYRFLTDLYIETPLEYILTGDINAIIKDIVLKQLSWNVYKELMPGTQAEWKRCKSLLDLICTDTLYDVVQRTLRFSSEQARSAVNAFIRRTNRLIDRGDINAEVLASIIKHNDGLRTQCESIAAEQWKQEHQRDIDAAQEELNQLSRQLTDSQKTRDELASQIINAGKKLESLKSEIERYEALGDQAAQSIRNKIEAAQKDMGEFLGEIAMYLPQNPAGSMAGGGNWKYTAGKAVQEASAEVCDGWESTLDILMGNLQSVFSMNGYFAKMLSAFLYAAFLHRTPLLIAGPYAREMADILAVTVYAKQAGILEVGEGSDLGSVSQMQKSNDSVVVIQNMFQTGWNENLLQALSGNDKWIVWTRPYIEDLRIEPEGLFNYVIPVFTECFIETPPHGEYIPGLMAARFRAYASQPCKPSSNTAFIRLRASKLLTNRLRQILSDAKEMTQIKSKDIEILFGVFPLALLKGQMDYLKEMLEAEKDISRAVKDEIRRYLIED